ncbi:putative Late nodulin [Medicago truncatula]|uniref:Nodule Cysteine-Rich (NCR) secreted peptide n=1 Tax=Medicago truncatula TaxID=3880 RepID=A0A072U2A2_MEDTR|nr:Nodule Cysteine-Rich (NCR) secreted peptide [Medicago truncatula]RHN48133.1 putative Late nodulin [Medicago truncatula]
MAETLKSVYLLILFISLFLVIIVSHSVTSPWVLKQHCVTDKDCPQMGKIKIRCRNGECVQGF